jgi:hypothetical protein
MCRGRHTCTSAVGIHSQRSRMEGGISHKDPFPLYRTQIPPLKVPVKARIAFFELISALYFRAVCPGLAEGSQFRQLPHNHKRPRNRLPSNFKPVEINSIRKIASVESDSVLAGTKKPVCERSNFAAQLIEKLVMKLISGVALGKPFLVCKKTIKSYAPLLTMLLYFCNFVTGHTVRTLPGSLLYRPRFPQAL